MPKTRTFCLCPIPGVPCSAADRDLTRRGRFDLHYYTGDEAHLGRPTVIAVDTKWRPPEPRGDDGEEEPLPPLEQLILSK